MPPVNTPANAAYSSIEPGVAAHQTIAAMLATTSWIQAPAAVTHSRARRSGKVHASLTLQKNASWK
jgi:hypothetical protein